MAILKVAVVGHPVLRQKAREVKKSEIHRESFQRFIDDMIDTMREYDGVGLAAPQVHQSIRVVVLELASNRRYPEAPSFPLTTLINPKITFLTDETDEDWEGCLSVPEMRGLVTRPTRIHVEALDRKGKPLSFDASDFFARALQHETDHLDGVLYIDRMDDLSSLTYLREFGKHWRSEAEATHAQI